jgi:phosphatidylserine decarboxylase
VFLKDKFFDFEELLGPDRSNWRQTFAGGDYAIFRLTPDKYHYNHTPVSGRVVDIYELDGAYHSCNPQAVVRSVTPHSKNRRVVTVFDTDIPGGSGIGLVAMVEVVALMIGDLVQCYSDHGYDDPLPVRPGMTVQRGRPKSLFRPGSSTDVLIFEPGRVRFDEDLLRNQRRSDVTSRFSQGFGRPLVETEVQVRARIALPADA